MKAQRSYGAGWTTTGFIVGFLFGVPRAVAESEASDGPKAGGNADKTDGTAVPKAAAFAHRLAVNTNLEQVSDWLTKIIVGVGLVELKNLP